ncbi:alpha/beta hydrolase [Spirochaeta africana]|uniref:Putative esterase n=1 Tax=Spirochaeta africana (strain ATCC 700263 / DSM 8902 / Z-7692) TaxID=889378 RepID=H9UFB8_SPIAZ|nr:alpha/beta hydrolase [Spirochaeta africana]AFG36211.1 putative esterase [Spirochaeta africana DSM 8902]
MHRPHHPFLTEAAGVPFQKADGAVILLHGRGGTARDILQIVNYLDGIDNLHVVAPQAAGNAWYPQRFLAPLEQNQPHLDDALSVVDELVQQLLDAGLPRTSLFLGGFSQGACLAAEYLSRNPQQLGGVFCLAGGLIGPPGTTWSSPGSAAGTPVYLGCAELDPHIPIERVHETVNRLQQIGCKTELHTFTGSEHRITEAELHAVESMLNHLG